jgi:hypothetical protein
VIEEKAGFNLPLHKMPMTTLSWRNTLNISQLILQLWHCFYKDRPAIKANIKKSKKKLGHLCSIYSYQLSRPWVCLSCTEH